jgi:hypothetical protein
MRALSLAEMAPRIDSQVRIDRLLFCSLQQDYSISQTRSRLQTYLMESRQRQTMLSRSALSGRKFQGIDCIEDPLVRGETQKTFREFKCQD